MIGEEPLPRFFMKNVSFISCGSRWGLTTDLGLGVQIPSGRDRLAANVVELEG
jgi:hypothetical protein